MASQKVTLADPMEAWDRRKSVGFHVANFAEDAGNPVDTISLPKVGGNDTETAAPRGDRSGAPAGIAKWAKRES